MGYALLLPAPAATNPHSASRAMDDATRDRRQPWRDALIDPQLLGDATSLAWRHDAQLLA